MLIRCSICNKEEFAKDAKCANDVIEETKFQQDEEGLWYCKNCFKINKKEVLRRINKALDSQFENYSWENMLKDCNLTSKEIEWAMEHTSYKLDVF